jgi:hypothetical protein
MDMRILMRAFHPAIVHPYHYRDPDINSFAKALELGSYRPSLEGGTIPLSRM